MKPVRVLLLIDSLTPEAGTENQVLELVRRLDPSQVRLFVACLEDGARLRSLAPYATLLVYPLDRVFSLRGLRQALRLRNDIRRHSIDIVHTFLMKAAIFGVLAAAGTGAKTLTSRRNMGYWYTPRLLRLFRLLNRFTTRVVANSQGARDAAMRAEGLRQDHVDVIYNGVDLERFARAADPGLRAALGIAPAAPVVGIVANYRPVKNLPLFLRAAQKVVQKVPEAVFVLVGRGPQQAELEQLAGALGIARRVFFTDDRGDVAAFYPVFQVTCLTSHSEGFSNAILEYMAAGLPVVATNVGGVAEQVEHGRTGWLVPPDDATALADAIAGLLLDPVQRAEMGRLGRERCERFAFASIAQQQERYYHQLKNAPV